MAMFPKRRGGFMDWVLEWDYYQQGKAQNTFRAPTNVHMNPQMFTWDLEWDGDSRVGPCLRPLRTCALPVTPNVKKFSRSFWKKWVCKSENEITIQQELKEIRVMRSVWMLYKFQARTWWKLASWSICWITQQGQQNLGEVLFGCVKLRISGPPGRPLRSTMNLKSFLICPDCAAPKMLKTLKCNRMHPWISMTWSNAIWKDPTLVLTSSFMKAWMFLEINKTITVWLKSVCMPGEVESLLLMSLTHTKTSLLKSKNPKLIFAVQLYKHMKTWDILQVSPHVEQDLQTTISTFKEREFKVCFQWYLDLF